MTEAAQSGSTDRELRKLVASFAKPSWGIAIRQLVDSLVPFLLLMIGAYALWDYGWGWSVACAAAGGLVAVRVFILFHDCTHMSWTPSRAANIWIGRVLGILVFTSYDQWRFEHNQHHAGSGDLDRRGYGDIDTLTIEEYQNKSFWGRLGYRLYRNPIVLLTVGPLYIFLVKQRFLRMGAPMKEHINVLLTNLALVAIITALVITQGWQATLVIELTMMAVASASGVWLFYVQHQYEDAYWREHDDWNPTAAAMEGSSYYDLPKPLHWLTGNIGFHHIHHLNSKVPNYRLEACQNALPDLDGITRLTLWSSLPSINLRLWDADNRRMITWREFNVLKGQMAAVESEVGASRVASAS